MDYCCVERSSLSSLVNSLRRLRTWCFSPISDSVHVLQVLYFALETAQDFDTRLDSYTLEINFYMTKQYAPR